jgi:DNA modification methylase
MTHAKLIQGNCTEHLGTDSLDAPVDLTFLDPPFNQDKDYEFHNDHIADDEYWQWMQTISQSLYHLTSAGGALYFMQREKNTEHVLHCLRDTGWTLQNLIIWKKKTSAVPGTYRFGKHYQVIAFATKGKKPRVFHRLRISPPLLPNYKHERENGMYVTDVWDDIRELTSGYFAGDEALRRDDGERFHKQQAPITLLLRILLSSTKVGDTVLDPFAGTGTTLVVASQLNRKSIGIEIDPGNVACIEKRLHPIRKPDRINQYFKDYTHTADLAEIWGDPTQGTNDVFDLPLFRPFTEE